MHVTTITESLEALTGRGRAHLAICAGLAERGHTVTNVTRDTSGSDAWEAIGTVVPWPAGAWAKVLRSQPVRTGRGYTRLIGAVAATRPDVIYVPQRLLLMAGAGAAGRARVPAVAHLHDQPRAWDRQDLVALSRTRTLIAVSEAQAQAWRDAGATGRFEVVHNGVDTAVLRPPTPDERREARASFGLSDDAPVVVFTGRLTPGKGLDVLVDAVARLTAARPGIQLLVAGLEDDREYATALRARIEGQPVVLAGTVDPVRRAYWAGDVAALASIEHDSFPLAPLEAMSCGLPVVVSRIGGMPEALPPCAPEWAVTPADDRALALALDDLLDWRVTSPSLGADVRVHVVERFSRDAMVDGVERVLHAAVTS